jgi:hypothetical protein
MRMRFLRYRGTATILGFAALMTFAAHSSESAVPDPSHSFAPGCLTACPSGDISYTVNVRDVVNNPIGNALVQVQLCNCSSLVQCPGFPAICTPGALTNAAGVAVLQLHVGGTCPGTLASVTADGVLLAANVQVRTLDLNADLVVNATDVALATGQLGAAGGIADFDCSGLVAANDVGLVSTHSVHACDGPVPANATSWGKVKTIYR